eukprot:CAMPEP_0177757412 /NCGR_PEP_ID=MMETSP0491_2-20121128/3627_1 /TAXON_ID=63592 /ORGANISM="Tetraselmis chuii, Strain PLY429" /LENGTH=525 /DNA_ID=CAMNT_0019273057 /DNA_START=612 /DNA_END=2189 /DNA_ORIENTATION=+
MPAGSTPRAVATDVSDWDTRPAPADSVEQGEVEEGSFQWTKHWYPIHALDHLDPTRPHHAMLLGRDLALWRDGSGKWQCFEDFCPHRLAPLSEGRVEADGSLLCAYHGWRFEGSGKCTALPQASKPVSEWKPSQVPCAVSYPTKELAGVVFVWPESGPRAAEEAAATAVRGFPEMLDDELQATGKSTRSSWAVRDLPYGWDFFMENALDPAHVPVSHHNFVGNRYQDPTFFNLDTVRPLTPAEGVAHRTDRPFMQKTGMGTTVLDFQPPCFVRIAAREEEGGPESNICLYATPIKPGYTRAIVCQTIVNGDVKGGKKPANSVFFQNALPKWINHMFGALFVNQDSVFLHHQEKIVEHRLRAKNVKTVDGYDMPTPSDKAVIAFRTWYERMSGGGVPWAPGSPPMPPAERDPEKLYNLWDSHVRHCSICKAALAKTKLWQKAVAVASVLCLFAGIATYSASAAAAVAAGSVAIPSNIASLPLLWHTPPTSSLWAVVAGALLAVVAWQLKRLERAFHVLTFSHADNH